MTRLIDISPRVSPRTAVWPGDVVFRREVSMSLEAGDHFELSDIRTTVHVGAHADAPSHYVTGGRAIEEQPLDLYYGACEVMVVDLPRGERIRPADLPAMPTVPRLLVRTGSFPDPERFNEDFNSFSPELIEQLHAAGVVLVGIDTPSVDPFADRGLRSHHALARCGMANLEGLVLDGVSPGTYTLIALPLPLEGADASPVRAALLDDRG